MLLVMVNGRDEAGRPTGGQRGGPMISVSMDEDMVVLRPVGRMDRSVIDTLLGLVAGARMAGSVAIVDLGAVDQRELARAEVLRAIKSDWSPLSTSRS